MSAPGPAFAKTAGGGGGTQTPDAIAPAASGTDGGGTSGTTCMTGLTAVGGGITQPNPGNTLGVWGAIRHGGRGGRIEAAAGVRGAVAGAAAEGTAKAGGHGVRTEAAAGVSGAVTSAAAEGAAEV